jgi:hypothetical protein
MKSWKSANWRRRKGVSKEMTKEYCPKGYVADKRMWNRSFAFKRTMRLLKYIGIDRYCGLDWDWNRTNYKRLKEEASFDKGE